MNIELIPYSKEEIVVTKQYDNFTKILDKLIENIYNYNQFDDMKRES